MQLVEAKQTCLHLRLMAETPHIGVKTKTNALVSTMLRDAYLSEILHSL